MNIETAKELKAISIGYTSWHDVYDTHNRYGLFDKIKEYMEGAQYWVDNGINLEQKEIICDNIKKFDYRYVNKIIKKLEETISLDLTNEIIIKAIELIKIIK